jgi:hypothetical protein
VVVELNRTPIDATFGPDATGAEEPEVVVALREDTLPDTATSPPVAGEPALEIPYAIRWLVPKGALRELRHPE